MAEPRHLDNAPITEAVVDIQVELPDSMNIARLEEATPNAFDYRVHAPIVEGTFAFSMNPQAQQATAANTQVAKLGLRLHSEDERYVAMVRLNGFSLSRLPPYENWDALKGEARRMWEIYVRQFEPVKVKRIAVRFINNLRLPLKLGQDFNDYVDTLGKIPPSLPQSVSGFAHRIQLHDRDAKLSATLQLAWKGGVDDDGRVPIFLDIDAFSMREIHPDNAELWQILDSLRALKNRCFFGSITEPAAELYQ